MIFADFLEYLRPLIMGLASTFNQLLGVFWWDGFFGVPIIMFPIGFTIISLVVGMIFNSLGGD